MRFFSFDFLLICRNLYIIMIKSSSLVYDDISENDFENKEELYNKQHLTNVEMEKLRNVVKTKIAGELIISETEYYF